MNTGKKMDDDEMMRFVAAVGRSELFDELRYLRQRYGSECKSSYYLKAVRATLCSLGYDDQWIETTLRDALEHYYYQLV